MSDNLKPNEWTKELETKLLNKNTTVEQEYQLTKNIDEHPEGWDGPCFCMLCQSYGD